MPTKAQVEAARVAAEARGETEAAAGSKSKAKRNLNDPDEQDRILHPKPATKTADAAPLTIGGQQIALHQLPAKLHREMMHSFIPVLAEASAARGQLALDGLDDRSKSGAVLTRWARVLAEDQALMTQFARFVARSERPADELVPATDLDLRAEVIDNTLTPTEIYAVFITLATVNGVFGSPK